MRKLSLNLLDKIKISFSWQKNILFTIGTLLITSGANALTGNWIIIALGIVSEEFFNKPLDNYDIIIGVFLLIIGFYFIYLGFKMLRDMNHDKEKWEEFITLADFQQTRSILQQIKTHFYYQSSQKTHLYNIEYFLNQPENTFLSKSIAKKSQILRDKLISYFDCISSNFFVYPKIQTQSNLNYGLQPGLDINKELQNYDQQKADRLEKIRIELIQKTETVESSLADIILIAKRKIGK